MTLTSIIIPRWISWNSETVRASMTNIHQLVIERSLTLLPHQPSGQNIHYTYGLHRRCSSLTGTCDYFPQQEDCHHDRYFCSMWRSVGFLMSFAVVLEGMTLITYAVILSGGMQKRAGGWKILSGLLLVVGVVELACMAIMVGLQAEKCWRTQSSRTKVLSY